MHQPAGSSKGQRMRDDGQCTKLLSAVVLYSSLNGSPQHFQLRMKETSSINAVDADGRTALSWAATRGDIEVVVLLLRYGADPNVPSHCGQCPLHWAAQNKRQNPCPIMQ